MKSFLIVYDRKRRRILELKEYAAYQPSRALSDLFERQLQERLDPNLEVVLLSADSLEALKHTHQRYFMTDQDGIPAAM